MKKTAIYNISKNKLAQQNYRVLMKKDGFFYWDCKAISNVKKGDKVFVMSGKDKGKEGDVLKIIKIAESQDKALVQGVNLVKRHRKPSQDNAGGIVSEERPIQISNLMIIDPKTKKPTRVGFKLDKKGNKVRYAKKSGEIING